MYRPTLAASFVLSLLATIYGCGPDAPPHSPVGGDFELREELRIGQSDGSGPDQFGSIDALAVDVDGRIHVLDGTAQEVRVFGLDGRFSHAFGGPGRGPGEFRGAVGLGIAPDGDVLIVDPRNARYTVFAPDGTLRTDRPRPFSGETVPWAGAFTPDGSYVDWGLSFPDEDEAVVGGRRIRFRPYLLSPGLEVSDSLPPLEVERAMAANGTIPMPFFANRLLIHQHRDGRTWFAHSREYQVFERGPRGDTLRIIDLPDRGVPIGRAQRQLVHEATEGRPDLREAYLEALPERKPVLHHVFGDGEGSLLVIAEPEALAGELALDVFREDGTHLARLVLPAGLELRRPAPLAVGAHLWAEVRDALDVPHVVLYRLSRRGSGATFRDDSAP